MVPKRGQLWLIIIAALVAVSVGTTVCWSIVSADAEEKLVINGVSVQGVMLGGLDRKACADRLTEINEQFMAVPLELRFTGRIWEVDLGKLGVRLDVEGITEDALAVGRQGLFVNQWIERRRTQQYGVNLPLRLIVSEDDLEKTVTELMGEFINPPVNAGFTITEQDTVELVPDQSGTTVDYAALKEAILRSVQQPDLSPVEITVIEVPPEHTFDEVRAMRLNGLVSQYTTRFDPSLVDRSYNVAVASKALDNLLIAPGEVVSFNEIVGPRSQEAGYRSALIIIENQFEEGMGGGVCQVSSTLYNTVLLANLEIIERKNHSLPVAYVPIGRDATVVYEAIDFKFRNNTEGFLYLKTEVGNGKLTMKMFGDAENHPKVEIRSWVTETIRSRVVYEDDNMLEVGEQLVKRKGVNGYRVKAERWVWRDGIVEKKELPGSFYLPQNEVIAVGTREAPPPVVAPVPDAGSDSWLSPGSVPETEETDDSVPDTPDGTDEDGVPNGVNDTDEDQPDGTDEEGAPDDQDMRDEDQEDEDAGENVRQQR